MADLQAEVGKIVKERDEYLKEKIQLEIQVEGMAKQITQLQTEVSVSTSQVQKLFQDKSDLQSQLMSEKDRNIGVQQDLVRLEAETAI